MQTTLFDYPGDSYNTDRSLSEQSGEQTRNTNYKDLQNNADVLCNTQKQVYDILLKNPEGLCDKQISEKTGLQISTVTGRRNELITMGLVILSDTPIDYPNYLGEVTSSKRWRAL